MFLNGTSLGTKTVQRNSHVDWKVKYVPGVIEVRGAKNGRVLTHERETTGPPASLVLRPDRRNIFAESEDVSVIAAEVVDAQGRLVPTASNEVTFRVDGPCRLIGIANGDPSCHEPDKPSSLSQAKRSAFNGLCMAVVQTLKRTGEIRVAASANGLGGASIDKRRGDKAPSFGSLSYRRRQSFKDLA